MPCQLQMIWPEGGALLPKMIVPAGYVVRSLREGDESEHVRVMREAGFASWDEAQVIEWRDRRALPEGIFVAVHLESGQIVATAMASHRPTSLHPGGGEVGWVAASPRHAGKGLGRIVSLAALGRFLAAGYRRIYLLTDDHRLAAIKTYLQMGFQPFLMAGSMESRWKTACERLNWPLDLLQCPRAPEALWIDDAEEGALDGDRLERYALRRKWLPARQHRGYSGDGDVDAFGDESLYRPSRLGRATVSPSSVEAGADSPLVIAFTAGPAGVPEGARVTFVMRGQSPLGRLPAFELTGPGTCELSSRHQGHCYRDGRLEQGEISIRGFVVTRGQLKAGEVVTLRWPAFKWTPLAGRREFKVVFNFGNDRPEQRFPEPLVVHVHPGRPACLEVTMPCTHRSGDDVDARITVRDLYDNRLPESGAVRVTTPAGVVETALHNGLGTCRLRPASAGVTRVSVESNPPVQLAGSNPCLRTDGPQLFVGDLHCHDYLSEAEGYPDEVYRWAIEDRRLDFVSIVPQSHGWHDNETWTTVKYMSERFLDEGRFVPLLGFEWQHTAYGDKVVHFLGGDQPYLPVDDRRYRSAAGLYAALRGSDALIVSHHPAYPAGSWCSSTDFDAVETDVERLVELWSMHGSSEGFDPADRPLVRSQADRHVMAVLKRGVRMGFTAGSDSHSARPGGSAREPLPYWGGLTAVWADGLTRRDLFCALYDRRTYALTRARIVLRFAVNGHPMGSEAEACEDADVRIDAWAPGVIRKVELLKNAALLRTFQPDGDECHIQAEDKTGGPAFYHCRVTLTDGNLAVCSPVWLG